MTVISEPIANIAGADDRTTFEFATLALRESADGTGTVTTAPYFVQAVDGVLTTPDLDPGPAQVRIGVRLYQIEIPADENEIRLWPLIEAGLPIPADEEPTAVHNAGGVRAMRRVTETWYSTNPHDPDTVYITVPD